MQSEVNQIVSVLPLVVIEDTHKSQLVAEFGLFIQDSLDD